MKKIRCLLPLLLLALFTGCTLMIDEPETATTPQETENGDGITSPRRIVSDMGEVRYQIGPETRMIDKDYLPYLLTYKTDTLDRVTEIYFNKSIPLELLPQRGEFLATDQTDAIPNGLAHQVNLVRTTDNGYTVEVSPASYDDVYKTLDIVTDFDIVRVPVEQSNAYGFWKVAGDEPEYEYKLRGTYLNPLARYAPLRADDPVDKRWSIADLGFKLSKGHYTKFFSKYMLGDSAWDWEPSSGKASYNFHLDGDFDAYAGLEIFWHFHSDIRKDDGYADVATSIEYELKAGFGGERAEIGVTFPIMGNKSWNTKDWKQKYKEASGTNPFKKICQIDKSDYWVQFNFPEANFTIGPVPCSVGVDFACTADLYGYLQMEQPFIFETGIKGTILKTGFHIDPDSSYSYPKQGDPLDKLAEFHYTGAASNDIRELKEASVSSDVEISVTVSADLKRAVKTFKTLTLTVPSYMRLDLRQCSPSQPDYDAATGVVTFHNVSSTANIKLRAAVKTLDFQKPATTDNKLRFTPGQNGKDGQVDLNGVLNVGISFDEIDYAQSGGDLYLSANMSMGSITVHEATGKFDPEISLRDLGRTTIGSVPDFLTDGEVSVNLYNPLIDINIQSDIDVAGFVSGTLYAEDANGQEMARVRIPEFYIRPDGSTHVCICKYAEGVDASAYDQVVAVPQLSDIMRRIPKTVRFAAEARADASREGTMELGKSYTIQPAYSIMAPLAFDEGARIVYNDTIDGWTDDLEDIDLMAGSAIELTANVENKIPAYLTVSATAIDVQGKPIPENRIKVEVSSVINASEDGKTPVVTPLKIRLTEGEPGSVALVDGLTFRIEAASGEEGAKSIVGQTINAYNHTLKARDIKVRLVGKIIVNKD